MTRLPAILSLVLLVISAPASAQFKQVANRIAGESGMSRQHLPGFGLARLAVRVAHPEGVSDLRVAIFDTASATRGFDAATILATSLDKDWQPLVRFADHRTGEQGAIYAKPSSENEISLMIFSKDSDESVLVELRVDAARLAQIVDDGTHGSFAAQ